MSTYTVTIDVADFDTGGTSPRLAFATFARASIDATTGEIITTAPQSAQLTSTPGTIKLEQGVAYRVRLDGVPSVSSPFYVAWTADCTLAALYQSHQVDPSSLAPLPTYPTIASQIAALQSSVSAITQGAPGAYDTFLEVATQFGLDEATVTTLQALVAGKASTSALTAEVTRATAVEGTKVNTWQPSTSYTAGAVVLSPAGFLVQAIATFTSGASFNAANWTQLSIDPASVSATYVTYDGTNLRLAGNVVPFSGGSSGSGTVTDLGNGLASIVASAGATITDLGNGLAAIA